MSGVGGGEEGGGGLEGCLPELWGLEGCLPELWGVEECDAFFPSPAPIFAPFFSREVFSWCVWVWAAGACTK